jgi:hypothetical protein
MSGYEPDERIATKKQPLNFSEAFL